MTEAEYKDELQKIEDNYRKDKNLLYLKYGRAQAKFGVGDIIKEGDGKILLVEKITANVSLGCLPCTVYKGKSLNKDLSVKKRDSEGAIYVGHMPIELIRKAETIS